MSNEMPLASLFNFANTIDEDGLPVLTVTYKDGIFIVRITSRHICYDVDLCCLPSDETAEFEPNPVYLAELMWGSSMDWDEVRLHSEIRHDPVALSAHLPISQPQHSLGAPQRHVVNTFLNPGRLRLSFSDDDVVVEVFDVMGLTIPGLRFGMNADGAQVMGGTFT